MLHRNSQYLYNIEEFRHNIFPLYYIDIESFDEAFSSDCTAENANNALCIYMCYIYGILSTSTEMIVPNFCSNLTISMENKITQNDEIGIILG